MVALRICQLKAKGYKAEEIKLLPMASSSADPTKFIQKTRASSFLRELLYLVGCDDDWISAEAERMFISKAAHGNSDDLDVTAHLLRRTIATFLGNGGMPPHYLDAFLGHKSDENNKTDFASLDMAKTFSSLVDRAIYLGSLCHTNNPAYSPLTVDRPTVYKLIGNTEYQFVVQEDLWMDLDITCLEPGRDLHISTSAQFDADCILPRFPQDTIEDRRSRAILPQLPTPTEVEAWIQEANSIDLTEIIKKYGK